MKRLFDWMDDRTGYRKLVHEALYEHIPGGARWRYVWGSTLVFCVVVQFITGLFLWMCYSPSSQTAWESVYHIQYEMAGGWLLRGLHHYTAQAMVVLLALHMLQVVVDGAYKAPREFNFWVGLVLLQIVLGLGLTGYLLPWDQKGYWATKVATNIIGLVPFVGTEIQQLVVGGVDYGHHTLTRFFAVHAGVLPGLMILFIGLHMYFFRRQGVTVAKKKGADCHFWPDQILKDVVACLAVLAVILFLVVYHRLTDAAAPLGAPLLSPAEPSEEFSAARPEWYFLFLFQFLKYFQGHTEVWGAIYIPGLVLGFMALMPFVGRWKLGHWFNVVFTFALLLGAAVLTVIALVEDSNKQDFHEAIATAEKNSRRVVELAAAPAGIPPAGAASLLGNDPLTQGPRLFSKHCSNCHRFDGHDGTGKQPDDPPSSPDLKGFGSREWLSGFLDPTKIATTQYYGGTPFEDGRMAKFVQDDLQELMKRPLAEFEPADVESVILAVSAEAKLPAQSALDERDRERIEAGQKLVGGDGLNCTKCHKFGDMGRQRKKTPDLTGWGSREWMIGLVSNPRHERFYGTANDRMPAYGEKEILDEKTIGLVVDWIREDWYRPDEEVAPVVATLAPAPAGDAPGVGAVAPAAQPPAAVAGDAAENTDGTSTTAEEPDGDEPANEDSTEPAEDAKTDAGDAETESAAIVPPGAAVADAPDFQKVIQPLLETYCYRCHGGSTKRKPRGEYNMKTRALALTPGDWGEPTIVPGESTESYLYQLISSEDEDERMPPEREPQISAEQVATIKAWIDAGAAWPDTVELAVPKEE